MCHIGSSNKDQCKTTTHLRMTNQTTLTEICFLKTWKFSSHLINLCIKSHSSFRRYKFPWTIAGWIISDSRSPNEFYQLFLLYLWLPSWVNFMWRSICTWVNYCIIKLLWWANVSSVVGLSFKQQTSSIYQ